jgi:hypothetical protein
MLAAIWEAIKGFFSGKGTTQIGSGNRSVSGVTAGDGDGNVVVGGDGNVVNVHADRPLSSEPPFEPTAEEKKMLLTLASSEDGYLMYTTNDLGPILTIDGAEIFNVFDDAARIRWIEAYGRLVSLAFLKDMRGDGHLFHLTSTGRTIADKLTA